MSPRRAAPAAIAELPGTAQALGEARAVVLAALAGCPAAEDAVMCVSELAANAVCHSRSGLASGTFSVAVWRLAHGAVRVAVTDAGSAAEPRVRLPSRSRPRGRGLAIVEGLSAAWGCEPAADGRVTWCEIRPEITNERPIA